jgi:hypothetical protein
LFDEISLFNDTRSQNFTLFIQKMTGKTLPGKRGAERERESKKDREKNNRLSVAQKGFDIAREFDDWSNSMKLNN